MCFTHLKPNPFHIFSYDRVIKQSKAFINVMRNN